MNKYELTTIIDAQLSQSEKDEISKSVSDAIAKFEGKIINSNVLFEKHRMSFPIGKTVDGCYTLYNVEIDGKDALPKLKRALTLNEKLLRFLFVRQSEKKEKAAA